jgi:hypothetical protein
VRAGVRGVQESGAQSLLRAPTIKWRTSEFPIVRGNHDRWRRRRRYAPGAGYAGRLETSGSSRPSLKNFSQVPRDAHGCPT